VGALTVVTGKYVCDVDCLIEALRQAAPDIVAVLDVAYATVTKQYRSVIEELGRRHGQNSCVIIRCEVPQAFADHDHLGEEALVAAVASVAKICRYPIVLAWCGQGTGLEYLDLDFLEIEMLDTHVVTMIEVLREDNEDDFPNIALDEMSGDLLFEVCFLDPALPEVQSRYFAGKDLIG